MLAAAAGDPSAVNLLIKTSDPSATDNDGASALMFAAGRELGWEPRSAQDLGWSEADDDENKALRAERAEDARRARCLKLLLKLDDVKSQRALNGVALACAARRGYPRCVELFIPVSDADTQDELGSTAFAWAARESHQACFDILLPVTGLGATRAALALCLDDSNAPGKPYADFGPAIERLKARVKALELEAHIREQDQSPALARSRSAKL